jgi:hypothetical protein
VRQRHFPRFLSHHHDEYDAEHDSCRDQHLLVGKATMPHERQDGDGAGEGQADEHAETDRLGPEPCHAMMPTISAARAITRP